MEHAFDELPKNFEFGGHESGHDRSTPLRAGYQRRNGHSLPRGVRRLFNTNVHNRVEKGGDIRTKWDAVALSQQTALSGVRKPQRIGASVVVLV